MTPYYQSPDDKFTLYHGDSLEILKTVVMPKPDMVFADPPYFLSDGGSTCKAGQRVKVDKGTWDKTKPIIEMHGFNWRWLTATRDIMAPDATLWVSGTNHVIYSVGFAMQMLGFKMLNDIAWEKPNPPPNLGCRCFTHSVETILWAARDTKSKHLFNYADMRAENGGKQMKTVWTFGPPTKTEKELGSHPTQKPVALLTRIISASTKRGQVVLDPFVGSGTTGVVAASMGRKFVGMDLDKNYLDLTMRRYQAFVRGLTGGVA